MLSEDHNSNAFRWIQKDDAAKKRDAFNLISTPRLTPDPISILRNGGRGFGLPPRAKFQSGHLPSSVLPVSQTIPRSGTDGQSGSDMDISSSDDEVYCRQYSVDSSPQDNKVHNNVSTRYADPSQNQVNCGHDDIYSGFSQSTEKIQLTLGNRIERLSSCARSDNAEHELSDSAASTEVSFRQCRSNDVVAPHEVSCNSNGYSSVVTSQDFQNRRLQNKKLPYSDVASAPPFGSDSEIERVLEHNSTFGSYNVPLPANSNGSATIDVPKATRNIHNETTTHEGKGHVNLDPSTSAAAGIEVNVSPSSLPACIPTFHASGLGPWCTIIAYDACVRLCLHSWAMGFVEEAPYFLNNECAVLRNAFGLQQVLLQSEEELLGKKTPELVRGPAAPKSKKTSGKIKVQVRRIKMSLDPPTGCTFSSLKPSTVKLELLRQHVSNLNSMLSSGWKAVRRVHVTPRIPADGTFSRQSLAYLQACTQYIKQVSRVLRNEMITLHNSSTSYETVQETYSCLLRLKSSTEEDQIRMQPGSGETHVFLPDGLSDDLIVQVQDSKGQCYGRVLAQVAAIADDPSDKLRWWPIYHEPEHELVGRMQLYINYSTSQDENSQTKCGSVAETVAYDLVLEVAMKVQHFQQRNLLLNGPWKWLVNEFASYYGVSDAYTKLRYLSYIMDVATPTKDCLDLVHDLLSPVLMNVNSKSFLSHQENRILGEIEDQLQQILSLVFENYKSLDELSPSGMMDVFGPATGIPAPALAPAVKLYSLLHDVLSPESQLKFSRYFQAAAKKRSRRHLAETDEFIGSNESTLMDPVALSTSYRKMKSLILNVGNEIHTDIEIHNQHIFPSFLDLPNLSASIYSVELCGRLQAFLVSCPPSGPSPPVVELVITTAEFQKDLSCWNINPVKGGVNAKELFHSYISLWIEDKRLTLLESCKLDKVKCSGGRTRQLTTPFIDDMYDRLKETLNEYEIIIRRWPEYTIALEDVIANAERAIIEALDKQYADVLSPLKDNLTPKIFGLKYVQKFAKGTSNNYVVPDELAILLNSMKRMLDVLCPRIEAILKSWCSCIPDSRNGVPGERLSEVTVMLRAKFRSYLQAVVEKLAENTRMQSVTKLKKIIQDLKDTMAESDVRSRMQPLKEFLVKTIDHLHSMFEPHVFIAICRGFWDQMGQDILRLFEDRGDNRSWYKGARISASILDDIFASQMQQLLGNALQGKDLEPPRSIMEVRSMLCKDSVNYKDNHYY